MTDSVMKSLWDAKDSIAAECQYSPAKLAEMLRASQSSRAAETVDYHVENRTKPNQRTR